MVCLMLLNVKNLSIARRALLLSGSLSIFERKMLLLKGPNGLEKHPRARWRGCSHQPGEINLDDDTAVYSGHENGLKARLSVIENLQFWADIFASRKRLEEALTEFDLMVLKHRLAGRLSAGQKRRLGLARLILSNRPLWLLDEPTVSLDETSRNTFYKALVALRVGGGALVVSHTPISVEGISSR